MSRARECLSSITTRTPKSRLKETLFTIHRNTVEPVMIGKQHILMQSSMLPKVRIKMQCSMIVIPNQQREKELTRKERASLAQLRSGECELLGSYKSRIMKNANLNVSTDLGMLPNDVKHLFVCRTDTTSLKPLYLWSKPMEPIRELSFLEAKDPNCDEDRLKGEQQQEVVLTPAVWLGISVILKLNRIVGNLEPCGTNSHVWSSSQPVYLEDSMACI